MSPYRTERPPLPDMIIVGPGLVVDVVGIADGGMILGGDALRSSGFAV